MSSDTDSSSVVEVCSRGFTVRSSDSSSSVVEVNIPTAVDRLKALKKKRKKKRGDAASSCPRSTIATNLVVVFEHSALMSTPSSTLDAIIHQHNTVVIPSVVLETLDGQIKEGRYDALQELPHTERRRARQNARRAMEIRDHFCKDCKYCKNHQLVIEARAYNLYSSTPYPVSVQQLFTCVRNQMDQRGDKAVTVVLCSANEAVRNVATDLKMRSATLEEIIFNSKFS